MAYSDSMIDANTPKPPASSRRAPPKRKPSRLRKYIKEVDLTPYDVAAIIKNIIFLKTEEELRTMIYDKKRPMIIRLFIKAFLDDFKSGRLTNTKELMDRALGLPKQPLEVEHRFDLLSEEERKDRIGYLLEKMNEPKLEDSDSGSK